MRTQKRWTNVTFTHRVDREAGKHHGKAAATHRAEVERLIRNEVDRAAEDNPLSRIVRLDRVPKALRVRATTEHLAKRIGQALHKAFHGTVRYRFSEENKFAHVTWSRDR